LNRAKVIQLLTTGGALVLFVLVFAAPKNYSEKNLEKKAVAEVKKDLDNQLTEIKKSLKKESLEQINALEKKLYEASGEKEKESVLNEMILFWDVQKYPGAAVLFMEDKAALTKSPEDWNTTGDRYLSMADFGDDENRPFRWDKAEECYRKALELSPQNLTAKTGLGTVLVRKSQNPMEGIALLREVVDADPKNIRALLQLADFSILSNQFDKAINRFDQILEADPNYHDAYFFKAETYAKMGDKAKAALFLKEYQKHAPDEEAAKEAENYLKENYGL
jgi:tetratricopeptide (TPR) repeat protein